MNKKRHHRPKRLHKEPMLIVCEDSHISQKYFKCIAHKCHLTHIDIPTRKGEGKSLSQLLDWAISRHQKFDKKYSEIYIVLDKDTHPDFEAVQRRIAKLKLKSRDTNIVTIKAILCIPCFEYWLMLHCKETNKPFISAHLKKEWKKLWGQEYEKNPEKIFYQIIAHNNLFRAIERAKKSRDNATVNNRNPWTNVDELIQRLLDFSHNHGNIMLNDFIEAPSFNLDIIT